MAADRDKLENAALALEELRKRFADDPWFVYQPHARQRAFIEAVLNGETPEAWMICANRAGKTDAAAYIGSGLARFGRRPPGFKGIGSPGPTKGWVISATTAASKSVVQPKYFDNGQAAASNHRPFIPDREIRDFNKNEQVLYLKSGSVIEYKTGEAKTISLAGAGLDWVHIDEELEKAKYDELGIRIEAGRRLTTFGACTLLPPEGMVGGVSWMFDAKIKPWLGAGGSEVTRPKQWNNHYLLFGASIYDNPHLLPESIALMESKYPVGSIERQIRLDGLWLPGVQGARAYTSFDSRVHVRPQIVEPRRPLAWIWDFNVEPMVSLVGQRRGDTFHILKELIMEQGDLDAMIQYFTEAFPDHPAEIWVYGDSTGRNRHSASPGGRSEYQIIMNAMRTYGAPVRLKVPEKNPNVPDRINAVNRVFRDEEGLARVEIDPSCTELIADFEGVLRDNRGGIKKSRNRHDPYYYRTHTSDAFGYWISYEAPVRARASVIEKVITAIARPGYGISRR